MLQPICDICGKPLKAPVNMPSHFCDRCLPFAEQYVEERGKLAAGLVQEMERRLESFRNKFLRQTVLQHKPKLEAVR